MVLIRNFFTEFDQLKNGISDSFLVEAEHFFDQVWIDEQGDLFLEHIFLLVSELLQ